MLLSNGQMSELDQIDVANLDFDLFALVKKHGRKQVFCKVGRRLLNDSFTKL